MSRRGRRGSTLIEAAFVFPMLLAILLGLMDFTRYLFAYQFVSYAAREATRFAQVRGADSKTPATPESVDAYVRGLAMGVDPQAIRVRTAWTPDNTPGAKVRVEVSVGDRASSVSEVVVLH